MLENGFVSPAIEAIDVHKCGYSAARELLRSGRS